MAAFFADHLNTVKGYNLMDVRRPTTVSELEIWIARGARGTWCLYWQGHLPLDKLEERKALDRHAGPPEYNAYVVSSIVYHAALGGIVEIFQRKVGIDNYRYWARHK